MELTFLKSFVLAVEGGSMAEAARRQNLTPAAIAQQIRTLERDLGAALLIRSGRTVKPTPAGHRLLAQASELLRQWNTLQTLVREDEVVGELRLGTINSALHTLLPRVLGRLASAYPDVHVFIRSGLSQQLVQAVRQEELDAAICLHPEYALPKTLVWEQLREEPLVVLAPAALADRDPVQLLRTQPFIRYDRSLGGGKQAERYLRAHGIVPQERFELSSLLAIAMMVHEGLGVSLIPHMDSPLTAGLDLAHLRLRDLEETRRFGVLWPRGSARSRLISAFVAQARAV